jgi:hypothetical protein
MGAGHQFEIDSMREKKKAIHPAWVAIGCFSLVGLSAAGFFLANFFIAADQQHGWIALPEAKYFIFFKLGFALIAFLIGSALFSILYGLVNPPKPGKYDVTDTTIFPPAPRGRKK